MVENMKPSGIAWIGDIPDSWEVKPIDYMSDSRSGGTPDRNNMCFWEDGVIPWMSSGEVNKVNVYDTNEKITEIAIRNSSTKIIKSNSVMVALNGQGKTKGMSAILRIDSACNQSLCAFSCYDNMLYFEYLFWCFQAMYTYLRQMSGDDVRDGLAASYVKKQKISVPSYQEQILIADFLNKQCAKIHRISTDIENQIELLERYKKSLITETVTKGLNKNTPMKDSGIDIVGNIVSTWELKRLKYIANIKTGNQDTQDAAEDGLYPFYVRSPIVERATKYDFSGEAILMAGDGVGAGKIFHHAKGKFACHQRVYIIYDFKYTVPEYLFYYLRNFFSIEMEKGSAKSTVDSIRLPMLQNFCVCIPIKNEQNQIADFLDKKCAEVDSIIETKKAQLEIMKKHKQSLIYEYVTGKKRVTEVQS